MLGGTENSWLIVFFRFQVLCVHMVFEEHAINSRAYTVTSAKGEVAQ